MIIKLLRRIPLNAWLITAGLVAFGGLRLQIALLKRDLADARVEAHNLRADRDQLRRVFATNTTAGYRKLARVSADLGEARRLLAKKDRGVTQTEATVVVLADPRETVAEVPAEANDTTFRLQAPGPPADVDASVTVRQRSASWRLLVIPTPLELSVDVGCRVDGAPDVLVTAPVWARVDSVRASARRGVCGLGAAPKARVSKTLSLILFGLGVLTGHLAL